MTLDSPLRQHQIHSGGTTMNAAKETVRDLLNSLPDDCSLQDVQYHLYIVEKIRSGIARAEQEGTLSQKDVERKLEKWLS